jgi:hypothetical protein
MMILVAPWLVMWTLTQRRYRFVGGLLAGGLGLLLSSALLYPRWPISFWEDMLRYSEVAGGRNPLDVLLGLIWPGRPDALRYGVAAVLVLAMLATWWRGRNEDSESFSQALHWTIAVSPLVPFQTGTTNQVMLLVPFVSWLRRTPRASRRWVSAFAIALELALSVLFLRTLKGDWENPIMFLPLPLFSLAVLIGLEFTAWRARLHLTAAQRAGRSI